MARPDALGRVYEGPERSLTGLQTASIDDSPLIARSISHGTGRTNGPARRGLRRGLDGLTRRVLDGLAGDEIVRIARRKCCGHGRVELTQVFLVVGRAVLRNMLL